MQIATDGTETQSGSSDSVERLNLYSYPEVMLKPAAEKLRLLPMLCAGLVLVLVTST